MCPSFLGDCTNDVGPSQPVRGRGPERFAMLAPVDPLHSVEIRVLGCLMEKDITTPEYYPLTLNALVNACNQKSSREPVVQYDDSAVEQALELLQAKGVATR